MYTEAILYGLAGGALIGIAAGAFLIFNGRIAGISGVLGGVLTPSRGDVGWRLSFLGGLLAGGLALTFLYPAAFPASIDSATGLLIAAGLLVGFGTRLGSGCTSGHGVCGMSRLSVRSFAATGTFIATGAITVLLVRLIGGGS